MVVVIFSVFWDRLVPSGRAEAVHISSKNLLPSAGHQSPGFGQLDNKGAEAIAPPFNNVAAFQRENVPENPAGGWSKCW